MKTSDKIKVVEAVFNVTLRSCQGLPLVRTLKLSVLPSVAYQTIYHNCILRRDEKEFVRLYFIDSILSDSGVGGIIQLYHSGPWGTVCHYGYPWFDIIFTIRGDIKFRDI